MKKILIIGPKFFSINNSVVKGFSEAGLETTLYDFEEIYPVNILTKITCGLFRKFGLRYFIKKYDDLLNKEIIALYERINPDLVLIIKGHKIYKKTLFSMKDSKLILWMMDSVQVVPEVFDKLSLYDFIYVFDERDIPFLKKRGIAAEFLPLALDNELYFPVEYKKNKYDLLFIGSLYENRINLLQMLIDYFPDKKIMIYGPFPSMISIVKNYKIFFGKYRKNFSVGQISHYKINEVIGESKIILNIHSDDSLFATNLRFFEIAGTGKIQIVNKKKFIDENFDLNGLLFSDISEIKGIIENVFYRQDEFVSIARNLQKKVVANHTFYNRAQKICFQTLKD